MNTNEPKKTNNLGKILSRTCYIFTPIILILYTIGALVSNSDKSFIPTLSTVYIVAVISLAVSLTSLLYQNPKLSFAAAHLINFFVMGIFYYFVVVVMRNNASDGGYTLVAMVFYMLIFTVITLCILGTNVHKRKKITDMKTYSSKFD